MWYTGIVEPANFSDDFTKSGARVYNMSDDAARGAKETGKGLNKLELPETEPRFGERKISQEEYKGLRSETPTDEIRDMVNDGITLPMNDPVIPGNEITKRLEADHIVSMDRITRMDGFEKLTIEQQLEVLNYEDNFVGLSKSANASKGAKLMRIGRCTRKQECLLIQHSELR